MDYKVVFTEKAHHDLKNIYDYISNNLFNKKAANDLIDMLFESAGNLSVFPKKHQICSEKLLSNKNVRYLMVKNFKVLYLVDDSKLTVFIARIIYSKKDFNKIDIN